MSIRNSCVFFAAMTIAATVPVATAVAEEMKMSVKSNVETGQQMNLPRNGQSQDTVKARWGQPQSMQGPVGEPPISTWQYNEFSVYFEYDKVIHTVAKQP